MRDAGETAKAEHRKKGVGVDDREEKGWCNRWVQSVSLAKDYWNGAGNDRQTCRKRAGQGSSALRGAEPAEPDGERRGARCYRPLTEPPLLLVGRC